MSTHKIVTVKQTGQQICWQKQAADLSLTVEPAHRRWTTLLSFHLSPSDHHQQPLGSLFLVLLAPLRDSHIFQFVTP